MDALAVPLLPHAASPAPRFRLDARVQREADERVCVAWRVGGTLAELRCPVEGPKGFHEDLWRHTCFEAFFTAGGPAYLEFNVAPAGAWAAYGFDDYRCGRARLENLAPPVATSTRRADELELVARFVLPPDFVTAPLRVGLTAVLEDALGALSYWALAHPAPAPDFHHPAGFILVLEAPMRAPR